MLVEGGASQILIEGNEIGTNADGNAAVPNVTGVFLIGLNNTVGGTAAGAGNLVGGNVSAGILTSGSSTGNVILGNLVGTNASGANLGNGFGIYLITPNNTVGGTVAVAAQRDLGESTARAWISSQHRRWWLATTSEPTRAAMPWQVARN